jgi:hypothetical protein
MLNWNWLALVVLAVAIGGWNNRLGEVTGGPVLIFTSPVA